MKDCTRVRRLTKLYVAMNAGVISYDNAAVALKRLLPDKKLKSKLWLKFNNMTDEARARFLKEIQL